MEKDCSNGKSSNVYEVIRAVLNFLLFFLQKDFTYSKSTKRNKKHKKVQNRNKQLSLRCTKKHKKVQNIKQATST